MADAPRLAVAVLAAGQSSRFGPADKLTACLRGQRLGELACRTLADMPFAQRWVIAARADHPCASSWQASGFTVAVNPQAASGMGTSVALAATLALDAQVGGLLIALADMPLVPAGHYHALIARAGQLAELDGEVVGFGALHVMWQDLAEVRTLAVDVNHKRRGLGAAMLAELLDRAKALGIHRVFCLTFEVEFFQNHGFSLISDIPVDAETYAEMVRSNDEGVAEFLDLARVKQNTLGNSRMLKYL